MKVFVTGGSGLVGQSTIPQLLAAGHLVTALARSDASAEKIRSMGATPIHGSHTDLDVLSEAAANADAVIHLAFNHEIAFAGRMADALVEDRNAIQAMGDALAKAGDGKTLIGTSGTLGRHDENDTAELPQIERSKSEVLLHSYASVGVRTIVVRLPPVTHAAPHLHPFITVQIEAAKKNGNAAYVGDGTAVWGATNAKDAGELYLLALSRGDGGSTFHACDESIPTKKMVEFIANKLQVPTRSADPQKIMGEGYGFVGLVLTLGKPLSSELTRKALGWQPKESGLFEALDTYYPF